MNFFLRYSYFYIWLTCVKFKAAPGYLLEALLSSRAGSLAFLMAAMRYFGGDWAIFSAGGWWRVPGVISRDEEVGRTPHVFLLSSSSGDVSFVAGYRASESHKQALSPRSSLRMLVTLAPSLVQFEKGIVFSQKQ